MQGENHHLFPNSFYTAPLETWATAIQRLPSEANRCFLKQVVHYKALSDMEHEFLVVYARHPSGSKIVLGVDRNAQDLRIAASKRTSGPASQDKPSTASTVASSSARYLNTLVCAKLLPLFSPLSEEEPSHLAYDGVQVSHDGTPAPILAQHGPCVPLYTITFPSTSTTSSNTDGRHPPSLLHLSVLLLTIRVLFPSYDLLQYQCYFFARMTRLSLVDLFGGVETELKGKRAATWRGVHVSLYSAGRTAVQKMNMVPLPLANFPAFIVHAGVFAVYSAVGLYDGNVAGNEVDRRRIR
jgi:hypothetical protein